MNSVIFPFLWKSMRTFAEGSEKLTSPSVVFIFVVALTNIQGEKSGLFLSNNVKLFYDF